MVLQRSGRINSTIKLDSSQKAMIEMAIQTLRVFGGNYVFEKFGSVINRLISSALLRKLDEDKIKQVIQLSDTPNDSGQFWLEQLFESIINQQSLTISYKSLNNSSNSRDVSPYLLKEFRNRWYFVEYDHSSNSVRLFKLSRISKLQLARIPFFKYQQFSEEKYFKYSLGIFHSIEQSPEKVILKINGKIAQTIIEDPIHPTMRILTKNSDESIIVAFEVFPTPELKNLILGFGAQIEVMEPESLKKEIIWSLRKNLNLYISTK